MAIGNYDEWASEESARARKREEAKRNSSKINKEEKQKRWISEQHTCEHCGKVMTEKFGSGRFCSRSCANSHEVTDEQKKKTSQSLKNRYEQQGSRRRIIESICPICKEKFTYTPNRVRKTCGRKQCINSLLSLKQKEAFESGRNCGWMRRNKLSYAEKFWALVLDNNGISYEHDFAVKVENTHYLLDFKIGDNIDLEIDGKQHNYPDRAKHDSIRDERLKNLGYVIYRVKYVDPKNSETVKNQVDCALEWIRKHL